MLVRMLLVVLSIQLAASVAAIADEVSIQRGGLPVEGEVCRFRAGDAENPFQRWLKSQDVTCVAASPSLSFPPGLWNVFAREAGKAISRQPLLIDGHAPIRRLSFSVDAAATLVPILPSGTNGVVYAPRLASAFPLAPGTDRVLVPAFEPLWLFVIEKSAPVALLPVAPLEPQTEQQVDARRGGPSALIGWLRVPDQHRTAIAGAGGLTAPVVSYVSGTTTRESDPIPPLTMLSGAFVRVRDVEAGEGELKVGGRGWLDDQRRVGIRSALTSMNDPLLVRAAGSIMVQWSTSHDLVELDRSLGACQENERSMEVEISLLRCPSLQRRDQPFDPRSCSLVRKQTFDAQMKRGSFTADELAPGSYLAELRFGKLPPVSRPTSLAPLEHARLSLHALYFELYGSLTHGGEPLGEDAVIGFPGGGYGFASAESGEYRAVLTDFLNTDAQIKVAACDGMPTAIVLNDSFMRPGARLDIDIPANELTIVVTDTFTGEVLNGTTLKVSVMPKLKTALRRPVLVRTLSEEDGRAVLRAIPPEREIDISVSHPGYRRHAVEPFSMLKRERKTLDVQLVPLQGSEGRIVSQKPFDEARVFWFDSGGSETEQAEMAADGSFVYAKAHEPDETMAVLSKSHALWVARSPRLDHRGTPTMRYPDAAPVREFAVRLSASASADRYIGVIIGGVRVPQPVFNAHQSFRELSTIVHPARQLHVLELLETGPIDVLLGPTPAEVTSRALRLDFFVLPRFAKSPKRRLGEEEVVFGEGE